MPKNNLFEMLNVHPDVKYECVPQISSGQKIDTLLTIFGVFSALGYLGYKYLIETSRFQTNQIMEENKVSFKDVYGLDQIKDELLQVIDFMQNRDKYKNIGARLKRGILFYGPPGTGKTLLAKATATESKCNFISVSASEFIEMYVGVGASRVRSLFKKARQCAPCIIFIDEIDGVAAKRSKFQSSDSGSSQESSSTLNQLLMEMDGFCDKTNIVVIGATNREKILDDAILRSGRFDIKIELHLPQLDDRFGILMLHLNNKKHKVELEVLEKIANMTNGYSGADLENLINESAYICIRSGRDLILNSDIQEAYNKIVKQKIN